MIIDAHAHAMGELSTPTGIRGSLKKAKAQKILLCPDPKLSNFIFLIYLMLRTMDRLLVPKSIKTTTRYTVKVINPLLKTACKLNKNGKGIENESVYSFVKESCGEVEQVYWVHPRTTKVEKLLERDFQEFMFKSIKLHQAYTPFDFKEPCIIKILDIALKNNLLCFIHLKSGDDYPIFRELAVRYSDINFILLHLIGLEEELTYKDRRNNIFFEISPYEYTSEERIVKAVSELGSKHVIFGSDSPIDGHSISDSVRKIEGIQGISPKDKKRIFGENIAALLRDTNSKG